VTIGLSDRALSRSRSMASSLLPLGSAGFLLAARILESGRVRAENLVHVMRPGDIR
jgi:hypothetical protein